MNDLLVDNTITKPWYVMKIKLGFETLYLSTGADADWDGRVYQSGLIYEDGFHVDDQGARIGLMNLGFSRTAPALRGEYRGGEIKVWRASGNPHSYTWLPDGYVEPGYEEGALDIVPELIFSGLITNTTRADSIIELVASRERLGGFPKVRINTPLANFTSRSGITVTVGGKIYTITQRGGGQ